MSRKIGYFESLHRASLKKQEREEAAAIREQERIRSFQIKRREREVMRQERENERHQKRLEKIREREAREQEKQDKIERTKKSVADFNEYLKNLQSLHQENIDWSKVDLEFSERLQRRSFQRNRFLGQEPAQYSVKEYSKCEASPDEIVTGYFNEIAWVYVVLYFIVAVPLGIKCATDISPLVAGAASLLVSIPFFFSYRKRRDVYLENTLINFAKDQDSKKIEFDNKEKNHFENVQRRIAEYKQAIIRFDTEEKNLEAQVEDNEARRLEILTKAKNGDAEAIGLILEDFLPIDFSNLISDLADSSPGDYEIGYFVRSDFLVEIEIHLPSREIIPKKGIMLNTDETKSKIRTFSEKERDEIYKTFAASFVLFHVIEVFKTAPYLKSVVIEASAEYTNPKTGFDFWKPELQCIISLEKIKQINLQKVDPIAALENFDLKIFFPSGRKNDEIQTIVSQNDLTWANENDDALNLPYGLLPGQNDNELPNEYSKWP